MKRLITVFFIIIMAILPMMNLIAQSNSLDKNMKETVPLKPLFEMFTSSTCGPCAYANPIFDEMMDANPGTHSLIKYQMDWPGAGDPYYTAEGGVRRMYYGVSGVPDLFVNAEDESPSGVTQEIYDFYQTWTTSMEIEVITAEIDLDHMISLEVNLNALDNYDAGLVVHVVVVEKLTVENVANNGETEFHNVMMKMFPDAYGTILPGMSNGDSETLTFTFDMDNTFMETANDLRLVVFVQDDSDHSLIQSEQVEVAHSLMDYTVTYNLVDFNSNPVEGATLVMEGYGSSVSNVSGQIIYTGVLPGSYSYSAEASGLIPTDGEIEVIDTDLTVDVEFGDPGYYYYEDFTDGIPDYWTNYSGGADFLYEYEGVVIFFRQSNSLAPLLLVTELIDITPGEKIFFDVGEFGGSPMDFVFGTMTNPDDPETFMAIDTIAPGSEWETYEYILEEVLEGQTEVHFAWKHNTTSLSYCSLDFVKINYKQGAETYAVHFSVLDGADPVEGAQITFSGITEITDMYGLATFSDIADGIYNYSIYAETYQYYEDQFEVAGADVNVEVNLLIDGVSDTEQSRLQIYPNPTNGMVQINHSDLIVSIEIFDLTGKQISYYQTDKHYYQLDLSSYKKGIYLLKMKSIEGQINRKIIIE